MTEFGNKSPTTDPIIPIEEGTIGSIRWSGFPREIFPVATGLARKIITEPKYSEAYEFFEKLRRAEDVLKMIRHQTLNFQNVPSKEEDPDIDNRWSDESIARKRMSLDINNAEGQAKVTELHEELRVKNLVPEFAAAYIDVESDVGEIVRLSLEQYGDEAKHSAINQGVYYMYANKLIDYNLSVLRGS